MIAAAAASTPGPGEAVVAVGMSFLLTVLAFPAYRYGYWKAFAKGWLISTIGYLVAGSAGGVLGWFLASVTHWQPVAESWFVSGVVYGAAGAALLRVDVSGFGFGKVKDSASALGKLTGWFTGALDRAASLGLGQRLDKMDDVKLETQARRIYHTWIDPRSDISKDIKAKILTDVEEAKQQIGKGAVAEGRERLRALAIQWMSSEAITDLVA